MSNVLRRKRIVSFLITDEINELLKEIAAVSPQDVTQVRGVNYSALLRSCIFYTHKSLFRETPECQESITK